MVAQSILSVTSESCGIPRQKSVSEYMTNALEATFSEVVSARVVLISFSLWNSAFNARSEVVSGLWCTTGKRAAAWGKWDCTKTLLGYKPLVPQLLEYSLFYDGIPERYAGVLPARA